MSKINIAFICDILEIGGQEMACLNILKHIDKHRFNPIAYFFRGGILLEEIRELGIKVIIGSNKDPLSFKRGWTEEDANEKKAYLNILIDEMRKDNITIALIFAWGDGVIAAREVGIPVLIERIDGELLLGKIRDKYFFDKIVCQSKRIKDLILNQKHYFKCKESQVEIIYNGIDLDLFNRERYDANKERQKLGLNSDEFVIGYIGRISFEKNLQLLIKSAKLLSSDYGCSKFKIVIIGPDHGDLNNVKDLIRELELDNKIIFTGIRKDIPNILSTFDSFVITSIVEGTPTGMLEAMAMGLPIVSTAVGSIPEMIEGNGFLIDALNPKIFAKKLFVLMKDTRLRKEMGKKSIRLSKKYDINKTMKDYEKLFINCLDKKHGKF